MKKTRTALGALSLVGLLALTACGSKDDNGSSDAATDSASAPVGRPGLDGAQLKQVRRCLRAAGLEDKIPTLPTDVPTGAPSDFGGTPPTGAPDGGFGVFQDEDVRAALTACGIDLPERPTVAPPS